jgi:hypothetical protein
LQGVPDAVATILGCGLTCAASLLSPPRRASPQAAPGAGSLTAATDVDAATASAQRVRGTGSGGGEPSAVCAASAAPRRLNGQEEEEEGRRRRLLEIAAKQLLTVTKVGGVWGCVMLWMYLWKGTGEGRGGGRGKGVPEAGFGIEPS